MKKRTSIRSCEVVSHLLHPDTNDEIINLEKLDSMLSERSCIKDYAYIIHDQDRYTENDELHNSKHVAGSLKPAHIHLIMRFQENQPQKLECVAGWFGLGSNFISKIKGSWNDACVYLIHRNAPEKYQYSPDSVFSNFSYEAFINNYQSKAQLTDIIQQIVDGEIQPFDYTQKIDRVFITKHFREITDAFKVRAEYLALTETERNTDVIFISGVSECGKTTLAKKIARTQGMPYYVTSGSKNPMDEYRQQPCIIADEMRPEVMATSDLLKFLDNNTASAVGARYKNKYINCKLIILTTPFSMESYFGKLVNNHYEPLIQLQRRCKTYIQMDFEEISVAIWDQQSHRYTHAFVYENDLLDGLIPETPISDKDIENRVEKFMPFLKRIETTEPSTGIILSKIKPSLERPKVNPFISEEDYKKLCTWKS